MGVFGVVLRQQGIFARIFLGPLQGVARMFWFCLVQGNSNPDRSFEPWCYFRCFFLHSARAEFRKLCQFVWHGNWRLSLLSAGVSGGFPCFLQV